jgi:serine/threonine-protein kinase
MEPMSLKRPDGDAFSLYLQARSEWNRRTPSSLRAAIRHLEQAIAQDGNFPLACAALADCYSILLDYGVLSPREGLTQARLASGRALHWGPTRAESLTAAALVRQMDLDWPAAETELLAAIEAHPGYAVARQRYALFLAWMGRFGEARVEIEIARTLEAHAPAVATSDAWIEYYRGAAQAAIRKASEVLNRYPEFISARAVLALSLIREGMASKAEQVLAACIDEREENVSLLAILAYAMGKNGRWEEAEAILQRLRDRTGFRYVSPYYVAVALMGLGRLEAALGALETAERERSPQVVYLGVESIFDPLRSEPEFQNLLGRARLRRDPVAEGDTREEVA